MHDPFQSYSTLGAYPVITAQTSLPHSPVQGFGQQQIHPAAILAAQAAATPLGISPWANPFLQSPLQAAVLANPLIAAALQNPFIGAGIPNPLLGFGQYNPFQSAGYGSPIFGAGFGNPMLGVIQQHLLNPAMHNPWASGLPGYQQQLPYSPFGHIAAQFGQYGFPGLAAYPLAPQTWVGQLGGQSYGQVPGQGYGQMQGQRPFQSPWAQ